MKNNVSIPNTENFINSEKNSQRQNKNTNIPKFKEAFLTYLVKQALFYFTNEFQSIAWRH